MTDKRVSQLTDAPNEYEQYPANSWVLVCRDAYTRTERESVDKILGQSDVWFTDTVMSNVATGRVLFLDAETSGAPLSMASLQNTVSLSEGVFQPKSTDRPMTVTLTIFGYYGFGTEELFVQLQGSSDGLSGWAVTADGEASFYAGPTNQVPLSRTFFIDPDDGNDFYRFWAASDSATINPLYAHAIWQR